MSKILNIFTSTINPEKFFIVCALAFGMLFILITPPFQGADEIVHYYRAYQVSELNLVADKTKQGVGGALPASIEKIINITNSPPIQFYPQYKYKEGSTKSALSVTNDGHRKFFEFSASAPYSPMPYLAASSGIIISKLLHLPTLVTLYAARLGNLLAWVLLMWLTIKYAPNRKWAFVALGLLPMALFQASTLNADAVTIGSAALLFALILKHRDAGRILSIREICALFIVAMVMVMSKQIMFVLLPLLFLLKSSQFDSRRREYLFKFILSALPIIIYALWMFIIRDLEVNNAYANHQNPGSQLRFILNSPQSFINVLWNTYFYTWGDGITRSFIGNFGWSDTPLSESIATLGYIGLAFLFLSTYHGNKKDSTQVFNRREKQMILGICLVYFLAVSASLYVFYSPVGFKIITGLQGRYYLPIAIMLIPIAYTKLVSVDRNLYLKIATTLPLFLLVASTITLYVRYFVNNV